MSYCYPPRTVTDLLLDIWPQPSPKLPERRQQCLEDLLDIQKKINTAKTDKDLHEYRDMYNHRWIVCQRDIEPFRFK
jgi:hypothetical protein